MKQQQVAISVFYSYAPQDRDLCDQLSRHLSPLVHIGLIREWSEYLIPAGADRTEEKKQALDMANIILLLLSADYLASKECFWEMRYALERHRRDKVRVVPIILRPCLWNITPLARLRCLPRDGQAITTWGEQIDKAFLDIAQDLHGMIKPLIVPNQPISKTEMRNRTLLLERMNEFLTDFLRNSLQEATYVDLQLQDRPDMLHDLWSFSPWSLEINDFNQTPRPLPGNTNILQIYDAADEELLILGEPGAGKSTLLLQLTYSLLQRARENHIHPLPAVFNLSTWALQHKPLANWLIEELNRRYQVSNKIGQRWIDNRQILPLLDGLDEMDEAARNAFVQAIVSYQQEQPEFTGTPLVICCRSLEYANLSAHLPLNRAVHILPLTQEQIEQHLEQTGDQLTMLRDAIHTNAELAELARTPLMLSVLTRTYENAAHIDLSNGTTPEEITQTIFTSYIAKMLNKEQHFSGVLAYIARKLHIRK